MKRLAPFVTLVVLLAACGRGDDGTTADPAETGPSATEVPATEPPDTDAVVTEPGQTEPTDREPATTEPADTGPVDTEPADTEPETIEPPDTDTTTIAPVEPAPLDVSSWRGPYDVGVTTVVLDDDPERPLTTDVWFPIDDGNGLEPYRYTFLPDIYYESPDAVAATPDALSGDGPFPLVVYSHGSGGTRFVASNYTEAIASNGYIVAAPDHTGNTTADQLLGTQDDFDAVGFNRPNDVSRVMDAMTDPSHPATGVYAAAVDPASVAVTGHSLGGYSTYAVATGVTTEVGTYDADPRVGALIPQAPASGAFTDEQFASITLPALVMGGTDDRTTPIDPNVTRPWAASASDPHYRLDLIAAEHQSFTDVCDYQTWIPQLDAPVPPPIVEVIDEMAVAGCSPGDMPIDRVQDLVNTFAVAFLDSVFRDDEMPDPDEVVIPDDVEYLVKGG